MGTDTPNDETAMQLQYIVAEILAHRRRPMLSYRGNQDRAVEAAFLCNVMEAMTGVDETEAQIADILTHLMHLVRWDDLGDFDSMLLTARMNFDDEVAEEEGPDPLDEFARNLAWLGDHGYRFSMGADMARPLRMRDIKPGRYVIWDAETAPTRDTFMITGDNVETLVSEAVAHLDRGD